MRYGRLWDPIDPSQVETPLVGVTEFLNSQTLTLYGKFPDGSAKPLTPGAGGPFESQAVNTGDANDLLFAVPGVVAYNTGDVYYLYITEDNTANVTMNINGLGAQDVKFMGNLNLDVPVGDLMANTVNAFYYINGRFEWIGMVQGDKVVLETTLTYLQAQTIGLATAQARLDLLNLPAKSNLQVMTAVPTVDFAGGTVTAAVAVATNVESALNLFDGSVNVFTGALAAGTGGLMNGLQSNAGIPSQTSTQVYRMDLDLTGDTWNNVTAGAFELQVHWTYVPW